MVNFGLSSGNGSVALVPVPFQVGGAWVQPPVQAGIDPSLAPAFSAPIGVRLPPSSSLSAWSLGTLARAGRATASAMQASARVCQVRMINSSCGAASYWELGRGGPRSADSLAQKKARRTGGLFLPVRRVQALAAILVGTSSRSSPPWPLTVA